MIILAIDTSSAVAAASIKVEERFFSKRVESRDSHFESLSDLIEEIRSEACVSLSDIDSIVLGSGPGSFTGLRIGLAFVQGLAMRYRVPVYAVSSFDAVAEIVARDSKDLKQIVVRAPARSGKVFVGRYQMQSQLQNSAFALKGDISEEDLTEPLLLGSIALESIENIGLGLILAHSRLKQKSYSVQELAGLEPLYVTGVQAKTIEQRAKSA